MDDPDCDSTWEDDEGDGEGPSSGGDDDGEAGAPGAAEDAEDGDEDEDEEEARPRALQVGPAPPGGLPGRRTGEALPRGERPPPRPRRSRLSEVGWGPPPPALLFTRP